MRNANAQAHGGRSKQASRMIQNAIEAMEPRRMMTTVIASAYIDANANGRRDGDELGAAGQTIYADYNYNGVIDTGEPAGLTSSAGEFIADVADRSFALRIVPTINNTVLGTSVQWFNWTGSGFQKSGATFALRQDVELVKLGVAISGTPDPSGNKVSEFEYARLFGNYTVWIDANRNQKRDADEAPLGPTWIEGVYDEFLINGANVPRGTYDIAFSQNPNVGALATYSQSVTTTPFSYTVLNVELPLPGNSVIGRFFSDANANGVFDKTDVAFLTGYGAGTSGEVFADYDGDNVRDADEPVASPIKGDENYSAINGSFRVIVDPGRSFKLVATGSGYGQYPAFKLGQTTVSPTLSLSATGNLLRLDLGFAPRTVKGTVYIDANRNNNRDPGEVNAGAGHTVFIDLDNDGQPDTSKYGGYALTTTAADGTYTITLPQEYGPLKVKPASGFESTTANIWPGVPSPGQLFTQTGVDFGIIAAPTANAVTVGVYLDANNNGVRDSGDYGLMNQAVFADYNYNGQLDAGEPSAVTDSTGGTTLNVDKKSFALRAIPTSGYVTTGSGVQYFNWTGYGFQKSGDSIAVKAVAVGQSLAVSLYLDANNNGRRDAGEAGVSAQTLYADYNYNGTRDDDEPYASTGTDGVAMLKVANKSFALRPILPGTYKTTGTGVQYYNWTGSNFSKSGDSIGVAPTSTTANGVIMLGYAADYDLDGVGDAGLPYDTGLGAFIDANGNGIYDAGDIKSAVGVIGGRHPISFIQFDGLVVGHTYRVITAVSLPTGQFVVNGPARDLVALAGTSTAEAVIIPIGGYNRSIVSFSPFLDLNGNGWQDRDEYQPSGLTVYADLNYNGTLDSGEPVSQTSDSSSASLKLPAGGYSIRIIDSTGKPAKFAYGASSLWIDVSKLNGYHFTVPISF